MDIAALEAECERLRNLAHEAPMNKVFETHTGHKFLGSHSTAWADRGREWIAACERLETARRAVPPLTPHNGE